MSETILADILQHKREQLTKDKAKRSFKQALQTQGLSVIAEIKRRSPAKAHLATIPDPAVLANIYAKAGAQAISVLTEEKYFGGFPQDLIAVRAQLPEPRPALLRKDFIIAKQQIMESCCLGADAILLIVAATGKQTAELYHFAKSCELEVLVEVHDRAELDLALDMGTEIIGVNNRDLRTSQTDIQTSLKLIAHIPENILCVSESGIHTIADAKALYQAGFDAILVGEALVTARDPAHLIQQFLTIGSLDHES